VLATPLRSFRFTDVQAVDFPDADAHKALMKDFERQKKAKKLVRSRKIERKKKLVPLSIIKKFKRQVWPTVCCGRATSWISCFNISGSGCVHSYCLYCIELLLKGQSPCWIAARAILSE